MSKRILEAVAVGVIVALLAAVGTAYVQVYVLQAQLEEMNRRLDRIEGELWSALNDHAQGEKR